MALYSLSCSIYSTAIEKLVKRFRAKPVYIGGQLVYSIGMIFMAIARSKWGVILFSWSAGIMYSTLFTMPYLIVAHYHETDCVSISIKLKHYLYIIFCIKIFLINLQYSEEDKNKTDEEKNQDGLVRGLGTDGK